MYKGSVILLYLLLGMAYCHSQQVTAQTTMSRHPMNIDDWKRWRSVSDIRLSDDGNTVVYAYDKKDRTWKDTTYVFDRSTKKTRVCDGVAINNYEFPKTKKQAKPLTNEVVHPSPILPDFSIVSGVPEGKQVLPISRMINGGKQVYIILGEKNNSLPTITPKEQESTVELWKWDEPLSPRRKARLYPRPVMRDRYIYSVADSSWITLRTEGMAGIFDSDADTMYGILANEERPWLKETDWNMHGYSNLYYFNLKGERKLIYEHQNSYPQFSQDGRYAVYFNQRTLAWDVIDMLTGDVHDLTSGNIPFPLYNEDHDMPEPPQPYGIVKWEGHRLIVYDRYDLWSIDVEGSKPPVCITKGYGRKNHVRLQMNLIGLSDDKGFYLLGFDERYKTQGLYFFDGNKVERMAHSKEHSLDPVKWTDDKKFVIWKKHTFSEQDYWLSDLAFSHPIRITDMNAPICDIQRGTAQLYSWKTTEGKTNEGILYLPEGFDKRKQYPVIVTFYELVTNHLHEYEYPSLSSTTIDIPYYVSNGYVVFQPDLHFTVGHPGESCLLTVVSGVNQLIKDGIADKDRVGVTGHSWGGYLTNYLVTHTDIFRCAAPCSAVSNITSNYLILRGTGQPNMYFEETYQGRLGVSMWDDKDLYIKESPIFYVDNIKTPMLIEQGEEDVSVKPDQGFAMFYALRRLGKPAWLLNYRNEGHQVVKMENKRDFTLRLSEFFNHYLKDKPLPDWMK